MKVRGGRPSDTALRRLRGAVHVVQTADGRVVARSWPRKRGPNGTPAQLAARAQFQNVLQWVGEPMTLDVEAAERTIQNTLYLPRDVMEMAAYGTIMQATLRDGRRIYGVRLMAVDIQALLDTISSDPGVILVRNGSDWVALPAGTLNNVLVSQGTGTVPQWTPVGDIPDIVPSFTPSVLYSLPAPVTNPANNLENTLATYTMPAGTLAANGDSVRISFAGWFQDSTHTRRIRCYFGTQVVADVSATLHGENDFVANIPILVTRTGATTQVGSGQAEITGPGVGIATALLRLAGTQNLAANVVIKFTEQSSAFGADTTLTQFIIEKLPA